MTYTFCGEPIEVVRIKNDTNGNPRYVIHFLAVFRHGGAKASKDQHCTRPFDTGYDYAVLLVREAGFKRFHNKQFGGGLVFQSYNVQADLDNLENCLNKRFTTV